MESKRKSSGDITPLIILHGGAGNWSRANLPPPLYNAYRTSLLSILNKAYSKLYADPYASALDIATYAVHLLENDPLFNAGKGAVFTRAGTNELESSIMVTDGYHKRGVGCMMLRRVKNPILLAREMLVRGEAEDGGGALGHQQLSGEDLERLAEEWGLEMVDPGYFWTKKRWEEHKRGIGEGEKPPVRNGGEEGSSVRPEEYLPQGTVGAVVLDALGTICVATSTGGLTNKLPGRIGDTPTLGAGFWAEQWTVDSAKDLPQTMNYTPQAQTHSPLDKIFRGDLRGLVLDCFPTPEPSLESPAPKTKHTAIRHATAISGTGNGDSFLRLSACRTASAISQYANVPLQTAVTKIAGPNGELQASAGDRWGKGFEGEGGMIGIELVGDMGSIVADFNCGGMFRAWIDEDGEMYCMVFREEYKL